MSRGYLGAVALVGIVAVAASGCGGDVCKAFGGKSCIALEVRGPSGREIDELHVVATAGFTLDANTFKPDHAAQLLPVQVPILPGDAYTGDFALGVDALVGGVVLGHADVAGTVSTPGQHLLLIANLAGPLLEADFAMPPDSDGGAHPDLSPPPGADGAMPPDLANVPPPVDSECTNGLDVWTKTTKATAGCDPRKAIELGTDPPNILRASIEHLAIARAPTGKVAVVYGAYGNGGPDQRPLLVSSFTGDAFPPTVTTSVFGGAVLGDREGTAASISANADGTMNICYLNAADTGNVIAFTRFDNANAFGSPEAVASGQGTTGYVANAVDGAGRIVCAFFNRSTNVLASKRRIAGVWDTSATTMRSGNTSTIADRGRVALTVADGSMYAGFHYPLTNTGAQPLYLSFDGTGWSTPKTVDNSANATSKNFGTSVSIAVFGTKTSIAYLAPNAGGKFDLRVATFASTNDAPSYEDVETDVADALGEAKLAMSVDPWGQLHIAYIDPAAGGVGTLQYIRQYPNGTGGLKWLTDIVDFQAGTGGDTAAVDIYVDSRARPHIVYYSGQTGKLMYATRTDRP